MTGRWRASLEGRLILRLVAACLAASVAGFAGLVIKSWRIARGLSDEGAADIFVGEFLKEAGWAFPLFALLIITLVVATVRSALRPLAAAAQQAAAIAPARADRRLPAAGLPGEILPFVGAVNAALERLEQGFEAQRRFTADAAHELRTPLAILIAGLEALPEGAPVAALRADAARMGRLVDQLLRVARLDALPAPVLVRQDLAAGAAGLVAAMAPWAHGQGRSLAFEAPAGPAWVQADADSLASALRNLIENAVFHAPRGGEVLVRVEGACVRVIDRGAGVAAGASERLFDRFWRAADTGRHGAGLGLAIVAGVAQAHGGRACHEETPGGGATFVLQLVPAGPAEG
ncbi:MAG TPA: HAMP domain-containing sensor histidine kinase [Novosphingobium sp.]|nr:HAMP domain-containing sensor histidine kinase [Novosphingobium sp.]